MSKLFKWHSCRWGAKGVFSLHFIACCLSSPMGPTVFCYPILAIHVHWRHSFPPVPLLQWFLVVLLTCKLKCSSCCDRIVMFSSPDIHCEVVSLVCFWNRRFLLTYFICPFVIEDVMFFRPDKSPGNLLNGSAIFGCLWIPSYAAIPAFLGHAMTYTTKKGTNSVSLSSAAAAAGCFCRK